MSYKFGIINYADQDLPGLVSDYLVEENRGQLAELLHLNGSGFIPIYSADDDQDSRTKKDQSLLKTSRINETYNNLLENYHNATKLVRKYEKNYSMVYADFDTSDKVTDSIDHCIWILITATDGLQQYNGLIHIPAHELKELGYDDYCDQGEDIFNKYKKQIEDQGLQFTGCYYGGGLIPKPDHVLSSQNIKDYNNATAKIYTLSYKFLNLKPQSITGPKGQGKECIIIETQKNRGHIFRPDDDLTMSNQIL